MRAGEVVSAGGDENRRCRLTGNDHARLATNAVGDVSEREHSEDCRACESARWTRRDGGRRLTNSSESHGRQQLTVLVELVLGGVEPPEHSVDGSTDSVLVTITEESGSTGEDGRDLVSAIRTRSVDAAARYRPIVAFSRRSCLVVGAVRTRGVAGKGRATGYAGQGRRRGGEGRREHSPCRGPSSLPLSQLGRTS
jgi:hypothetical protein